MDRQDPHNSFEHHVIARRDERSIYLQNNEHAGSRLWSNNLWCTIAIDDHGQIVVFGTNPGPMVFGIHRGTLEERIAWMGSHPEADSYVVEKANIGMSKFRRAMTVATAETFEADVREVFRDKMSGLFDPSEEYTRLAPALTWEAFEEQLGYEEIEMLEQSAFPAQRALDQYLSELGYEDQWEWIGDIGERPVREVALAHAALRRAHLLIEEGNK